MGIGGGKIIVIVLPFFQMVGVIDLSLLWVYSCVFSSRLLFLLLSLWFVPASIFLSTCDSQFIQTRQVAQSLWG